MVAHRFAHSRVSIRTGSPAHLPTITGDPRLLEQALINLLLNACDASPPGASVQVSLATDAEMLLLSVVDQGSGISPKDVDRALQPFFTTKPDGKGSGLGLAVAREIVNSHRGHSLWRQSHPEVPRLSFASRFLVMNMANPARVLIVDDNVEMARSWPTG